MKESQKRIRLKVFEKLFDCGYDTDDKLLKLKIEDLLKISTFSRSDLVIANAIKEAYISKNLITFLSGSEERRDNK